VCDTAIGDALVASLPATLVPVELRLVHCGGVTRVRALRVLYYINTELAPAALVVCRERGCVSVLGCHTEPVSSLAVVGEGWLASGDCDGTVRLWDATRGGEATAVLDGHGGAVRALAALPDGRRLAAGVMAGSMNAGEIAVWDTSIVPPNRTDIIGCGNRVFAVAALRDGRLAAGGIGGRVRLVEVGAAAGTVATMLDGHTGHVTALVELPDGTLVSGSWDNTVRLWDVGTRARFARRQACVATLAGHTSGVNALAVLADGRLASGSGDWTVRLWNIATRTCVGVLEGHMNGVLSLAALPDGRLASGLYNGTIRVWDTRSGAAAADATGSARSAAAGAGGLARATPVVVLAGHTGSVNALASLPGGRLASGSGDMTVRLWCLPPL